VATYKQAKERGLCQQCRSRPPVDGKSRCEPCREKLAANYQRNKQDPEWVKANRRRANAWQKANPARKAANTARYRLKIKNAAYDHYGRMCRCCGETRPEFLTIDHVNNDGAAHRRAIGRGVVIYKWLRDNGYPSDFQVLCWNCNLAKYHYGSCPHESRTDVRNG
jgi:hypothetical protein